MKMKNVVVAILCVIVAQSVCAKEFQVVNMVKGQNIEVKPYWTDSTNKFVTLHAAPSGVSPAPMTFDPGRHHLKNILWKEGGMCYRAEVEDVTSGFNRFRSMKISIDAGGSYKVEIGGKVVKDDIASTGNC